MKFKFPKPPLPHFLKNSLLILILLLSFTAPLYSTDDNNYILQTFTSNISETFKNYSYYNLYIPFYMWHNRLMYDSYKTDRYNEIPLGLGFAVSRETICNIEHSLFSVAFSDSNHKLQITTGYTWQKKWYNSSQNWWLSAGYTAHFIQRYEYLYIPIPMALPVGGIGYKSFAIEAAYFPGPYNDGNVLFTWARFRR